MLYSYFDAENNSHKSFELPGSRPHYSPDRPGQVTHIALDLDFDIPKQRCQGTCTIQLTPIRNHINHLTLDAVNLEIKSAIVDEVEQDFYYDGQQFYV